MEKQITLRVELSITNVCIHYSITIFTIYHIQSHTIYTTIVDIFQYLNSIGNWYVVFRHVSCDQLL